MNEDGREFERGLEKALEKSYRDIESLRAMAERIALYVECFQPQIRVQINDEGEDIPVQEVCGECPACLTMKAWEELKATVRG